MSRSRSSCTRSRRLQVTAAIEPTHPSSGNPNSSSPAQVLCRDTSIVGCDESSGKKTLGHLGHTDATHASLPTLYHMLPLPQTETSYPCSSFPYRMRTSVLIMTHERIRLGAKLYLILADQRHPVTLAHWITQQVNLLPVHLQPCLAIGTIT